MIYRGPVVKTPFGVGSRSEHEAVILVAESSAYVLRRKSGNSSRDPELEALVGKSIACEGVVHVYTLIVSEDETIHDVDT